MVGVEMGREWAGPGCALEVKQTGLIGSLAVEARGKKIRGYLPDF